MQNKQKLAELMGESNFRKPKIVKCPIIRFNGNKCVFTRMDIGKDGEFGEKIYKFNS